MRYGIFLFLTVLAGCGQRYGGTPLIGAARTGDIHAIRVLIDAGADPNERGGVNGWPPLMHAIHKNRMDSVEALLKNGADPNERASGGSTALIMAAGYGYSQIVRLLLENGADPRMLDSNGRSAIAAAVSGVPDIDKFTLGSCQNETVKTLEEAAPDVKAPPSMWSKLTWLRDCTETRDSATRAR